MKKQIFQLHCCFYLLHEKHQQKIPMFQVLLKKKKNSEMTVTCGVCPSVHGEVHQVIFVQE